MPEAQTLICGKCGSYIAIGAETPQLLSTGGKLQSAPAPIRIGQTFTLEGVPYFVMGRVMYRGWDEADTSDYWTWNEWQLGAADGRILWLSYDTEAGFVLYHKVRMREAFEPRTASAIPLGQGQSARVKERYPAQVTGAQGELTSQIKRGDKLYMVEAERDGKRYSMQVTSQELELHEGRKLDDVDVATALGDEAWLKRIKQKAENRKTRDFIGLACLIFAALALVGAAVMSSSGELIAAQTIMVDSANPVMSFPVEFDQAGRPANIRTWLETQIPANTFVDIDVSVTSPNEVETVIFEQEFYHETGSDEDGPWTEKKSNGGDMFVPYLAGTHHIEVSMTAARFSGTTVGETLNFPITARIEVYRNNLQVSWLIGYGVVVGIIGLLFLTGGVVSWGMLFIIGVPVLFILILLAVGVDFGGLVNVIFDLLSEL